VLRQNACEDSDTNESYALVGADVMSAHLGSKATFTGNSMTVRRLPTHLGETTFDVVELDAAARPSSSKRSRPCW